MSEIDGGARPEGSDAEPPRRDLRGRIARLIADIQDRLWSADEKWAADRGHDCWRSPSGWSVDVRDPRFDFRRECADCDGTGRHRITGDDCAPCDGIGVVTEIPPEDEDGEPR